MLLANFRDDIPTLIYLVQTGEHECFYPRPGKFVVIAAKLLRSSKLNRFHYSHFTGGCTFNSFHHSPYSNIYP